MTNEQIEHKEPSTEQPQRRKLTERPEFDLAAEIAEKAAIVENIAPRVAEMSIAAQLRVARVIVEHAKTYMTLHHYDLQLPTLTTAIISIEMAFAEMENEGCFTVKEDAE